MFINNMFLDNAQIAKMQMGETVYTAYYIYWLNQLFERVMRIFVWENTYEIKDGKVKGVLPKEIEQRLLLNGHCGITKYKGNLTAFFGAFYGPTVYMDEWTNYTVHSPVYSGKRQIGRDIVVIDNNALRNSTYDLCRHYAQLLAHNEISLVDTMVNLRKDIVPIASDENQRKSILNYLGKIWEGKFDVVKDPAYLGVQFKEGSTTATAQAVTELLTARKEILSSFYSDVGIKSAFVKKSNTVSNEVEADMGLLLLNLKDMIDSRKMGAEKTNDMYKTNWNVRIADEIDYAAQMQDMDEEVLKNDADSIANVQKSNTGSDTITD